MGLARVERDDNALAANVDLDRLHAGNFHERLAQFADAFIAVFAFSRDRDRFQNRVIGPVGIMWVGWVHRLIYARRSGGGRFLEKRFENSPDIFGEDTLPRGVRMDAVPLIEFGIAADAFQEVGD
jgi:hypothetical protein